MKIYILSEENTWKTLDVLDLPYIGDPDNECELVSVTHCSDSNKLFLKNSIGLYVTMKLMKTKLFFEKLFLNLNLFEFNLIWHRDCKKIRFL